MAAVAGGLAFVFEGGAAELLVDGAVHAAVRIKAETSRKIFFMG